MKMFNFAYKSKNLILLTVLLFVSLTSCFQVQMDIVFFKNMDGTVSFVYEIQEKYFNMAKLEGNPASALLPLEKEEMESALKSFAGLSLKDWQQTTQDNVVRTSYAISFDKPESLAPILNNWEISIIKQADGKYKFTQKLDEASIAGPESEKFMQLFKGMKLVTSLTSETVHQRTGNFVAESNSSKSIFVLGEAELFTSSAEKEWIIIY